MTDHPRFQQVVDPPDVAYRAYHGWRLVEFVFWLVDRRKRTRRLHQTTISPRGRAARADDHRPEGAAMPPRPVAVQQAASRQTADDGSHFSSRFSIGT